MALLRQLLYKRRGWVIFTLSISMVSILISFWWNSELSVIINAIQEHEVISNRTVLLVTTILISSVVAYALGIVSGWTCETLTHDLRMGYARHCVSLPINEIENINAGEHLSKLQNENADVSGYLRSNLVPITDDCVRFIATFAWMLWLNPKLTLLSHVPIIFIMWYTIYSSKIIGSIVQQSQQVNAQMNGYMDTLISLFPILRVFSAFPLIRSKYGNVLKHWEAVSVQEERTRAKLMSLSALLTSLPLLLLFLIGGSQVIRGELSLGTLYIFINLSGNVSGVWMNMPGRVAAFRRFAANKQRVQPSVRIEAQE